MVRDPGRAPSGQPPSQGGQPDRKERHRTHRTGAGEVRTTPSTVGGGRPPTYREGSSDGGSSEGGRPRMFEGGADVAAFTRTQMQEWMGRVLERGLEQFAAYLAIATRLAAKYGPVSVQYQNAERRVEIRREKNVMVTNPFGHQGFAGFRARFKKAFGMYPLPKHTASARAHVIKRVFQFMENGRDIPESEVAGPSNAEAGEDGAADDDFAAATVAGAGAAAAAGTGDGVDDDALTDFSEGLSGAELEEDKHGLTPQQEQHAESGGDDEDDTPPAQPPAPSTVVPAPPAPRTLVPAPPAPRTVVPRPSVRGTVVPSASVARTDAPQPFTAQTPLAARSVVPESSTARTAVT
ncbi:hypothetical protein R1sor_026489 [Riccia sorocarpa]|uniref:Uncharacterized protein n=1 Tax=Riccia sorocarpa TaxID=122646 RepID=A0ABD3GF70_9MARC